MKYLLIVSIILLSSCFTRSPAPPVESDTKLRKETTPEKPLTDEEIPGFTHKSPESYREKWKATVRILSRENTIFTKNDLIMTLENAKYIKPNQLAVTLVMTNKTNEPITIYDRGHHSSDQQWQFTVKSKKGQMIFVNPMQIYYFSSYYPPTVTIPVAKAFKKPCVLWVPGKLIKINDKSYRSAPKPTIDKKAWFFTCQAPDQERIDNYKKLIKTDKFDEMPEWQKSHYLKRVKQDPRHNFILPCEISATFTPIKLRKGTKANYSGPAISGTTILKFQTKRNSQ